MTLTQPVVQLSSDPVVEVTVNGISRSMASNSTVLDLVRQSGLSPELVAVEINRQLVRRASFETHKLNPGDLVEIVEFVGGG